MSGPPRKAILQASKDPDYSIVPTFRKAAYLPSLQDPDYAITPQIAGTINYLLDSFFKKQDDRNNLYNQNLPNIPADPSTALKEAWLGCEIHKCVRIHQSYPPFLRNLHAWAFSKMFEGGKYEIVPVLDTYEWKDFIKGNAEFKIELSQLNIDFGKSVTLPIHGLFFVLNKQSNTHLLVNFDFCFYDPTCSISVNSSPENKADAEQFLRDFEASVIQNDIYYKKCLSYNRGTLDFISVTKTSWSDIILKPEIVGSIRDNTIGVLKNMNALQSVGMCPNRNIILISPPGMAKTTIFRATAMEVQGEFTCIWCTGKSITYPEDVTSLFQAARTLAPCIIFIEDMDLFGRSRGDLHGHESHVLNEFLACLDGVQENSGVVVMASTNDINSMDEALINRPGRFDFKIEIPLPDANDRAYMLSEFLKKFHAKPDKSVTNEAWSNAINMTDGLTGAYVKDLAKSIIIRAVSAGRCQGNAVQFSSDDLIGAAEQILKNFSIGKKAILGDGQSIDPS